MKTKSRYEPNTGMKCAGALKTCVNQEDDVALERGSNFSDESEDNMCVSVASGQLFIIEGY